MSTGGVLDVEPSELQFPFELAKQLSCRLKLSNNTENNIAFKVLTTNIKNFSVRPKMGIILPQTTCELVVTMQAQKEIPPDNECKDKLMVQSLVVDPGATSNDITSEMFKNEGENLIEECKLRAVYVFPTQDLSPVAQVSESSSFVAPEMKSSQLLSKVVANTSLDSHDKSSEVKLQPLMRPRAFLIVQPPNLIFNFELRKQISSSVLLSNMSEKYIAFKVKTTHQKKYCVRPCTGIIKPQSRCDITVTMQAQNEVPADMLYNDKFLIQSVVIIPGATVNDITRDMFNDSDVIDIKLNAVYLSCFQSPSFLARALEEGSLGARTLTIHERESDCHEVISRHSKYVRWSVTWFLFGIIIGLLILIF